MRRQLIRCGLGLVLAATATAARQPQTAPEAPSIWREVAGVTNLDPSTTTPPTNPRPQFLRPHIPAYRTTADGRVGVIVEGNMAARFGLIQPEKLSNPLLLEPGGGPTINEQTLFSPSPAIDWAPTTGWTALHTCIWDDGTWPQPEVDGSGNPIDRYEFTVVSTATESGASPAKIRIYSQGVKVLVRNPKTANATIDSVTLLVGSPSWTELTGPGGPIHGKAFEPAVASDGRLLVVRIASTDMTWNDPNGTGAQSTGASVDIVYSWSDLPNEPLDASKWTEFYPIALAPHDKRINGEWAASQPGQRYEALGFALEPFRDPTGQLIANASPPYLDTTIDIGGSYPWIDRAANNLFMETIFDRLSPDGNLSIQTTSGGARYDNDAPAGDITEFAQSPPPKEDGGKHQGICVVGKWTQGKIVQIDNLNNDVDYALGLGDTSQHYGPQHRVLDLYQVAPFTFWGALPHAWSNPDQGQLLATYGRATKFMPQWENDNGNIIDSLKNKLNYKQHATPLVFRDVTWHLNNSKQTDEIVFDDYLDPDAFVLSNMTGALEYDDGTAAPDFLHHTGWNNTTKSFDTAPRLQNAAAPKSDRWAVPSYGQVVGTTSPFGRIEPVASGGVHGKGFWLDGSNGVEYTIPSQPSGQSFAAHDWYVGLFLDSREAGSPANVRILRFPDGSELWLDQRPQFLFMDRSGSIVHSVTVPTPLAGSGMLDDLVPDGGWCHVALQIMDEGRAVDFHLNGLPLSRWESHDGGLFQMEPPSGVPQETLLVGTDNGTEAGFRGWIDDFKVLAHTVDLESACNHAGGTLVGLNNNFVSPGLDWLNDFAKRYPDWVHERISDILRAKGEATFDAYACFYDYRSDGGVNRSSVAALLAGGNAAHLRAPIHFPEGPRFKNRPRPDTRTNRFCLSCHHVDGDPGLTLGALTNNGIDAPGDPRRQPSDPPMHVRGHLPNGLVDSTSLPSSPATSPDSLGTLALIDDFRFTDFVGPAVVGSITLVDDTTGKDIMDLPLWTTTPPSNIPKLDPAIIGTADISLRVNLDHGQDSVDFWSGGLQIATDPVHPYTFDLPITSLNPSGLNQYQVTPANGVAVTTGFEIAALANPRIVANFQNAFQAGSPREGWLYGWNANGPVLQRDSFRSANWLESNLAYTDKGQALPEPGSELDQGHLHATGGHPGHGTLQGSTSDRFVMVGYRVKWPGYYAAVGSATTSGSSIETQVMGQIPTSNAFLALGAATGSGTVSINSAATPALLAVGDILWVAIGPDGDDTGDDFSLDFDVWYRP